LLRLFRDLLTIPKKEEEDNVEEDTTNQEAHVVLDTKIEVDEDEVSNNTEVEAEVEEDEIEVELKTHKKITPLKLDPTMTLNLISSLKDHKLAEAEEDVVETIEEAVDVVVEVVVVLHNLITKHQRIVINLLK